MANEKLRAYFDRELLSTLVYALSAVIAGYLSFMLNQPRTAVVAAIAVIIVATLFIRYVLRIKEKYGWYIKNGIIVFLFMWFIVWTVFYNVNIVI